MKRLDMSENIEVGYHVKWMNTNIDRSWWKINIHTHNLNKLKRLNTITNKELEKLRRRMTAGITGGLQKDYRGISLHSVSQYLHISFIYIICCHTLLRWIRLTFWLGEFYKDSRTQISFLIEIRKVIFRYAISWMIY